MARTISYYIALFVAVGMQGCTAVSSMRLQDKNQPPVDGLVYHLPLKKLKLTVTVTVTVKGEGKAATTTRTEVPSVDVSEAYADASTSYILQFNRNYVGKNDLKVGISEKGLLKTASATTTSSLSDVLKGLAGAIGTANAAAGLSLVAAAPPPPSVLCPDAGTYVEYVEAKKDRVSVCNTTFDIKMPASSAVSTGDADHWAPAGTTRAGFYYRQLIPVTVRATTAPSSNPLAFIVFVPDPNQISYLTVPSSLFASSAATLEFTDGMPTKYEPNADSEVLALVKLPADVLSAYFAAVGAVFDNFSGAQTKEKTAETGDAQTRYAEWRADQCRAAIADKKDSATITAACTTTP